MITARLLNHVCDQLGSNGCSTFVLFVLSRIREERYHRRDPFCACNFTRMDHYAELHQRRVDSARAGRDNIHIIFTDRLCYPYVGLAIAAASNLGLRKRQANARSMNVNGFRPRDARLYNYRRAMISASSGWLVPAKDVGLPYLCSGSNANPPENILIPVPFNMVEGGVAVQNRSMVVEMGRPQARLSNRERSRKKSVRAVYIVAA